MVTQVITITRDGVLSGLQVKPGKGLDLRQFGKADIVRASEIAWDGEVQAWFVDVIQEAGRGKLTVAKWRKAGLQGDPAHANSTEADDEVYMFDGYDDAVAAEIEYLNALRWQGIY
jgi:hypothetical protein